ncbi:MAG: DUF3224 domain-containing protein [Myxococcaceae bacterium]
MENIIDVRAVFSDSGWDERSYVETDGVKLAKVRFERAYRGDLEGNSVTELLMVYRTDASVTFTGLERFEGRVLGKSGSFVIHSEGEYRDGATDSRGKVVPGAGTGELLTLSGNASYKAGHDREQPVVYRLALG